MGRPRTERTPSPQGHRRALILFAACALLPAHGARADARVYRWTDGSGHVHFGQIPPAAGAYESVRTRIPPAPSPAEAPGTKRGGDTAARDTRRFLEQAEAANREKAAAKDHARRARQEAWQQCQQARQRVQFLEEHTARRLASTGPDGQPQRIPEDEFLRRLDSAQDAAGTHCR